MTDDQRDAVLAWRAKQPVRARLLGYLLMAIVFPAIFIGIPMLIFGQSLRNGNHAGLAIFMFSFALWLRYALKKRRRHNIAK